MEKITDIRKVRNSDDLISYFAGKLGWNIDVESFDSLDDVSYEFTAADLGLNEESFAKIRTLRQLRPLDAHQKWGMFCIEFDSAKFEVSALRKVLSGLIPRRRKLPNHSVWNLQDILFLCDWGDAANRTVGVAHFEEREKGLPQIKISACTPSSCMVDQQELRTFEERLSGLAWPNDTANWKDWSEAWSKAFTVTYRETIVKSAELTVQLAKQARDIRDRIHAIMAVENAVGYVHRLWDKFRQTLVADMSAEDFADTYAQTMVYGLFSARCMDKTPEDFSVEEAIDCMPSTNPFLKNLMRSCLGVRETGNTAAARLAFDELEIDNVVELLAHTDVTEIVKDFNRTSGNGKEDPVIYFYERFAEAYDAEKKIRWGEFFTPLPIVNFIVRAVDDILKKDFGYADGLATTAMKKIKYVRKSKKLVNGFHTMVEDEKEVPAIQLLDPATGTGTFLRQAILKIHENFLARHKGTSQDVLRKEWNKYVSLNLLPQLNGFEINMASYAVAHMKLAMVLKDTGYDFKGNEQLHVHLTDSLIEPGSSNAQQTFWDDPLAAEAIAANKVKSNPGVNIVIGNPPYNGESKNKGAYIMKLMEDYKKEPGGKEKLQERNPKWLNDDYVKFMRLGQEFIARQDECILAYICPHGFLDNPTFRGMRWNLLKTYDDIYVLNLHGNAKKKETAPDGSKDENVFDIKQGVCISIFVRRRQTQCSASIEKLATVHFADLYGLREAKYSFLGTNGVADVKWQVVSSQRPYYFFVPKDFGSHNVYEEWFKLDELMLANSMGVTSGDDKVLVSSVHQALVSEVSRKYAVIPDESLIKTFSYRPFDNRLIYFDARLLARAREKFMGNFMSGGNLGLCAIKICSRDDSLPVFVSDKITDKTLLSSKDNANVFPLYLYDDNIDKVTKVPNLDAKIVAKIEKAVGKTTPEDIFNYIYAVLHTPEYREKYKEFLKIDFPGIPYPKGEKTFKALVENGAALVATHLLKSAAVTDDVAASAVAVFATEGVNLVEKPTYANGSVKINHEQAFANVPEKAWNFYIGGYQPAQKWLKDRKGRTLSEDDIQHYRQIVHALLETDRLMGELSALSKDWM